jgi:hypothetical protein
MMPRVRGSILLAVTLALGGAAAPAALADRPAGRTFSWSHELNQNELPGWKKGQERPLIAPRRWYRTIDGILATAGRAGMGFTGPSALPLPPLPLAPAEPIGWRTNATLTRQYRRTRLRWDVAYEVWAARNALEKVPATNPRTEAHARRLSLLHPAYRREALREIRRLVPRYRGRGYVNAYAGSDEPIVFLPAGRKAVRSSYARSLNRAMRSRYGTAPPRWNASRTRALSERLKWVAYSDYVSDRFFAMKAQQARLIRKLDPKAVISPNDYAFIDGFMPWDYTRLSAFADIVEADPYVSFAENVTPGRGRYNPGFGAKLMSDLTGERVRIVLQAFDYAGYEPEPGDLWTWGAQALRAGATDLSFFASDNPRFTRKAFYRAGMLQVSRAMRGARLPDAPVDPATLVLYSTTAEGQAQPHKNGGTRYKTTGDELYATHALLGELGGGAFSFEADSRIEREPERLAAARTLWMPRGEVLERAFAERVRDWVRAGGTLIVTDPAAYGVAPDGSSLADLRDELIGAPLAEPRRSQLLEVDPDALSSGLPADELAVPALSGSGHAFASTPADATVIARFIDGAPAAIVRPVGQGRVLAFSTQILRPEALDVPMDLVTFTSAIHAWSGGGTSPAWDYRLPGDPDPTRLPWKGSYVPDRALPAEAR